MEEEKKEFNETPENEEKEKVEVEIVEETKPVETSGTESVDQPEVEEVIEPGLTRDLTISQTTYTEFFNRNMVKRQILTTVYTVVIMIVILYLFRKDQTIAEFLAQAGIFTGVIIVVSFLFGLLSSKMLVKKNYIRSGLDRITINVTFNSKGIYQQVENQKAATHWEEIANVEETENSLFFISGNRRAIILSTDKLMPGDREYIRSLATGKVGEEHYKIAKSKKEKGDSEIR